MTDINFVRDGEIGDKVWDSRYGNGNIQYIDVTLRYSINVLFIAGQVRSYDRKGFMGFADEFPPLHWGHREPSDQGKPPERFEYPLLMTPLNSNLVVEFTDITTAKILVEGHNSDPVGTISYDWVPHTDTRYWKTYERPAWKLNKPTWCYVKGDYCVRLIYRINPQGQYVDNQYHFWTEAEPCSHKDIPDWWPKEWI